MTREDFLERIDARGKELLDIGTGKLSIIAARDFDCDVTCVDISQVAVDESREEAARLGLSEQLRYEHADGAELPFDDNSYDLAVCWNALHHIPPDRREAVVRELCRTARETVGLADFTPEKFEQFHGDSDYTAVDFDLIAEMVADCGEIVPLEGNAESTGLVVQIC